MAVVWLRRDLRLADNTALFEACRSSQAVCVAFVLDPALLLSERTGAPIVNVFFDALTALRAALRRHGSDLVLLSGDPAEQLTQLAASCGAEAVFFNRDYEPAARARDARVADALQQRGVFVHAFTDHVYFGADEVLSGTGQPYRVFTPYKRRWLEQRAVSPRTPVPSRDAVVGKLVPFSKLPREPAVPVPSDYGHPVSALYPRASEARAQSRLDEFLRDTVQRYAYDRNFPGVCGTSLLSPQLRAGTIGVRTCVEAAFQHRASASPAAQTGIDAWVSELIWRDFYQMILRAFPHVAGQPFLEAARQIEWRDDSQALVSWQAAETGYPIVDAAMRQLNETGWMHNRLRMTAASFLSKHLLVDPRRGERYFERMLADSDLAQNNGGWQWAASTGADAVPYFRMFNPIVQSKRFDPSGDFIKRMLPQLEAVPAEYIHEPWRMPELLQAACGVRIGKNYPPPIVQHELARDRALDVFGRALGSTSRERRS